VEERDLVTSGPRPWALIDELDALLLQSHQNLGEIGNAIGDVVESLAPFLQEPAYRSVGVDGLEELDRTDETDADALAGKLLDRGAGLLGHELEKGSGFVE
jgi:hypothetical protein